MSASDDATLELIRQVRDDVVQLRDNHLHHIEHDMNELKSDVKILQHEVSIMRQHGLKIVAILLSAIIGAPIVL